ncbi:MAG: hypothetical protein IT310_11530 [Anaerolineales bacterium]|nr:hypothetical protein [Anaerolineales bacterium]
MKKNFQSIFVSAVILALITSIGTITILRSRPSTVAAQSIELASSSNENSTVRDIPAPANIPVDAVKYPLTQKVNEIKMEVTGTGIETTDGEYFTADVCYDFPEQKTDYEFTLGGQTQSSIALTTANETILIYSWKIMSGYDKDANGNFQGNCARLYFPISPSTSLDDLTLTISRISTPLADFPDCDKAQKKLDDAKKEIKVKCDKSGGFVVSEKPDAMSKQEARETALEAFIDIVDGPWIFKLK